MVEAQVNIVSSPHGSQIIDKIEQDDDAVSVTQSTTSSKRKAVNKNVKVLKIVNMIFEKKKKEKVTKLETAFADGSKIFFIFLV